MRKNIWKNALKFKFIDKNKLNQLKKYDSYFINRSDFNENLTKNCNTKLLKFTVVLLIFSKFSLINIHYYKHYLLLLFVLKLILVMFLIDYNKLLLVFMNFSKVLILFSYNKIWLNRYIFTKLFK